MAVGPDSPRTSLLIDLVYELLDAHSDTMALACQSPDPAWAAHADYVRALQRRSREILAAGAQSTASTKTASGAASE
jgi:hypothetical protein